jgi:SAM-dependent methyltransferase
VVSETDPTRLYSPPPWAPDQTLEWLESCAAVQSMQFMIDCLPMIRKLIVGAARHETLSVLDVGTGTGAGANLLATLYQGIFLGPRMRVDAIEIAPHLKNYAELQFPLVNYLVGDVLSRAGSQRWDLVICSHTIEHVDRPESFVAFLAELAHRWVLLYAPWKERALIPGHVNRIDRRFLRRVGSKLHTIIESPAWYRIDDERARCVVFAVSGRAARDTRSVPDRVVGDGHPNARPVVMRDDRPLEGRTIPVAIARPPAG